MEGKPAEDPLRLTCSPLGVSLTAAYGTGVKKVEKKRIQRQAE